MGADLGPEITGYAETEFKDGEPNGPMIEYRDPELPVDLTEEQKQRSGKACGLVQQSN